MNEREQLETQALRNANNAYLRHFFPKTYAVIQIAGILGFLFLFYIIAS